MKKIHKPISKSYPPLRLFLEDIQGLEAVLAKGKNSTFQIQTSDHILNSSEELDTHHRDETLKELKIASTSPYVTLELRPSSIRVYCNDDDETLKNGIFKQVDDILENCVLKPRWFFSVTYSNILFWVAFVVITILQIKDYIPSKIGTYLLLLALIYNIGILVFTQKSTSQIIVSKKKDKPSYFLRNWEKLSIEAIKLLLVFALGVLSQHLDQINKYLLK